MDISAIFDLAYLKFQKELSVDENFDILSREITIANQKSAVFFIDGYSNAQVSTQIMSSFLNFKAKNKDDILNDNDVMNSLIPFVEVNKEKDMLNAITSLYYGSVILIMDKIPYAFIIDAKTYPQRTEGEPQKDKVIRGSQDGFVETTIFNTALLRRRIRSNQLSCQRFTVGSISKTDIIVCYMKDRCDNEFLDTLRTKLENLNIEALTMSQETLSENLFPHKWYNPYPLVLFSERPDKTSSALLQGNIVIITDNSPLAMILPSTFFDFMKDANDYYFPPLTGTYYRFVKTILFFISLFLTPIWLFLLENPYYLPSSFSFLQIKEPISIPIFAQLLIMEFILEVMRICTLNTPDALGASIGIVGALLVGDFAVSSGWLSAETVFYMSFLAVALYSASDFEFGYTIKFFRIFLLFTTHFFGLWGLIGGSLLLLILTISTKTVAGHGYLYPLIPFNANKLMNIIKREKLKR